MEDAQIADILINVADTVQALKSENKNLRRVLHKERSERIHETTCAACGVTIWVKEWEIRSCGNASCLEEINKRIDEILRPPQEVV